jgi:hypothetical protein
VVDLGSGGGVDVFLAAVVGPTGSAIGLDMSEVCYPLSFSFLVLSISINFDHDIVGHSRCLPPNSKF